MLVIDNGDAIRGIAEVASKLSFTISGYVGTTATSLAQGQIGSSEGNLYASGADGTVVTSITVVNTDSVARTFTLYFLESGGGTSWAITPVSLDLGIGYSLYTDGQRVTVMDASGNILSTATVLAHDLGGASHTADTLSDLNSKISDATLVDATAISSEIDGDISTHAGLADPHTGYRLESADHSHQTTGAQAGKIDHGAALDGLGDNDHTQYVLHTEVDDTPVDGVTTDPVSSNWAFDHAAAIGAHPVETLPVLLKGGNLLHIPTNAGWTEDTVGSGVAEQWPGFFFLKTGATVSSRGLIQGILGGFARGLSWGDIDWTKKTYFIFDVSRSISDSEIVSRFQFKTTTSEGALGAKGIGIRIDNFTLKGESFGSGLGVVDLATTLVSDQPVAITIIHYPASKIEWYVDEVLKATQSTGTNIPSGTSIIYVVFSIINGGTGGVDGRTHLLHPKIWQEA